MRMFSRFRKNEDARQEMKLRSAATALAAVAVIILGAGFFMLVALASGYIKTTGTYTTTKLVAGSYSSTVECSGSVEPIRVTDVNTKAAGTVTAVYVQDGQYVKQGTVLFEIQDAGADAQAITASVSGTVMNMVVAMGMTSDQLAQAGMAMQIADMNVLVGVVQVPEYVSVLLEDGQYANVTSTVTPGVHYKGMLTGLSKDSGSSSLTSSGQALYDASIMFDDPGSLKVGDPIDAQMRIDDFGQVFYVPANAVREIDGTAYVDIVRSNGTIEQHQVELLGTGDDGRKIIKGDVLTSDTTIRADLGE